jgi:hypothetical protein
VSHYWADREQCSNLHMSPDFYLSTNLTQRRSPPTTRNVIKGLRSHHLSNTGKPTYRRLHNGPPTRQPASAGKTLVMTRSVQQPPCHVRTLISYAPWHFQQGIGISGVSRIGIAPHVMSCTRSHLWRICIAANTATLPASYLPHGFSCSANRYAPVALSILA